MTVEKLDCGGIVLIGMDTNQVKRLIHIIMKYKARSAPERHFKMVMNDELLKSFLRMCKKEINRYSLFMHEEFGALMLYEAVSSYTDEITDFTRSLTAKIHNAIPTPLDSIIEKHY